MGWGRSDLETYQVSLSAPRAGRTTDAGHPKPVGGLAVQQDIRNLTHGRQTPFPFPGSLMCWSARFERSAPDDRQTADPEVHQSCPSTHHDRLRRDPERNRRYLAQYAVSWSEASQNGYTATRLRDGDDPQQPPPAAEDEGPGDESSALPAPSPDFWSHGSVG